MPDLAHKVLIAGVGFDIEIEPSKMRNMHDAPYWDATTLGCVPIVPGGSTRCTTDAPFAPAKGLSGTKTNRFRLRRTDRSLRATQAYVRQFVLHHDGCTSAGMCWDVLQNERGLSCHFILDDNGTLYQTLDLADCAYHAAGLNETSIGIEISNRGDAHAYPGLYGGKRRLLNCTIHGEPWVAYEFTEAQKQTMIALGRTLAKALPGIPLTYPQTTGGEPVWGRIAAGVGLPYELELARTYAGYLGHYHITRQKWDPGPWDFRWYLSQLSGRWSFPIGLHDQAAKPEIPENPDQAQDATNRYYANNEQGDSGFFPVGPFERYRLYHGGVHLHGDLGAPVYAPMPGHVVAARNGPPKSEAGSVNFVLLRHRRKIGDADLEVYSLYFHLGPVEKGDKLRPRWMASKDWDDSDPGAVVVLASPEPVQAGDVIGFVGEAGPERRAELHFEIFTDTAGYGAVKKLDTERRWLFVSGSADRRFCSNPQILDRVEANSPKARKNRLIDADELRWAFTESADRDELRWMATYHYSEWTDTPDWTESLLAAPELKARMWGISAAEIPELVNDQITPTLWWTPAVGEKLGLPATPLIVTYHPITFLSWLAGKAADHKGSQLTVASRAVEHANKAIDDNGDVTGESMLRQGEEQAANRKDYTLDEIVNGTDGD